MRAGSVRHTAFWPGLGAFCLGLSLIGSATVLNVAHDRLSERDLSNIPVLAPLYDAVGKFGVTLLLVCLGLLVIVLGAVVRSIFCLGPVELPVAEDSPARDGPVFYTSDGPPPDSTSDSGRMVLTTRKYLRRAALSGVPGWDATKREVPPQ